MYVAQRCAKVMFWLCFNCWSKKKWQAIQSKCIELLYNIMNVSVTRFTDLGVNYSQCCFSFVCIVFFLSMHTWFTNFSLFSFMALTMSICQFSKQSTCNVFLLIYMCFMSLCVSFDCMIFNRLFYLYTNVIYPAVLTNPVFRMWKSVS